MSEKITIQGAKSAGFYTTGSGGSQHIRMRNEYKKVYVYFDAVTGEFDRFTIRRSLGDGFYQHVPIRENDMQLLRNHCRF